jgi:hypothetical protein
MIVMIVFMALGCLVTFLAGVTVFGSAKSVIHEIEGCLLLVMSVVLFCSAGILAALDTISRKVQAQVPAPGQVGALRTCPSCAEAIRVEAITCRYCQSALPQRAAPTARRPLRGLDAAGVREAQGYLTTLTRAGYPECIKGAEGWEITTAAGRVAYTVATVEELREAAQQHAA